MSTPKPDATPFDAWWAADPISNVYDGSLSDEHASISRQVKAVARLAYTAARAALAAQPAPSVAVPGGDVVGYVARWGGQCRDCADENGVCPNSGLPCGGSHKAIEHVISALRYGVENGYISNPLAASSQPPTKEKT